MVDEFREFRNIDYSPDIMARLELWNNGISFYLRQVTADSDAFIAQPLEFKKHDNQTAAKPFLTLSMKDSQRLMDELWKCGLRPSEGSGSAGSLRATENHLSDMRKIVSNLLDVDLTDGKRQY
jgi:hypothetical protein